MANSSTISFRLESDIVDRLDLAATEAGCSRSHLAREALLCGLRDLADEGDEIDVPEHLAHDAEIQRLIARNKAERRRGKFRSEFSKQLKRSFENNETPAEFRQSVSGYLEEADRLGEMPEPVRREVDADVSTYREWCDHMLDYYNAAYSAQTFDHDPINDPLGNHEGIENAKDWVTIAENIATADPQPRNTDGPTYGESQEQKQRKRELARKAIKNGTVPDAILEQAGNDPADRLDAVVAAAEQAAGDALTGNSAGDQPELTE